MKVAELEVIKRFGLHTTECSRNCLLKKANSLVSLNFEKEKEWSSFGGLIACFPQLQGSG